MPLSSKLIADKRLDMSSTNITTSAYVELVDELSTAMFEIEIFIASGENFVLAYGDAGSEVDFARVPPGGLDRQGLFLGKGSRLSIKAVSGNVTAGELVLNCWETLSIGFGV